MPAMAIPPRTPPGGASSPASWARRRISTIAQGNAAEVPMPTSTRATVSIARFWPRPPTTPPRSTSTIPNRKTRRAPSTSASFPAVGCATALAR